MFVKKTQTVLLVICLLFTTVANAYYYDSNDFAVEVISSKGPFGSSPHDEPNSVLGKPATWIYDFWGSKQVIACSLVMPAYFTDPNGKKLIISIGTNDANDINESSEIIVEFNHRVSDDIGNPYGIDFLVFGNSFFDRVGNEYIQPYEDMNNCMLENPTSVFSEPVLISVAQDSNGPWYSFADGPYGDTAFPTNAFAWDSNTSDWGGELDWLKPVNPNLDISDFDGLSVADAIGIYDGSAGGTGFDIKALDPNDYADLESDPNTGKKWIQYIKVQYLPYGDDAGEIDAFSDVAGGGDYKHPVGDLTINGKVDYEDLWLFSEYWLVEINAPSDSAVIADIYEDGIINFYDWTLLAENWQECTLDCE